jgi:hypothetical protein
MDGFSKINHFNRLQKNWAKNQAEKISSTHFWGRWMVFHFSALDRQQFSG